MALDHKAEWQLEIIAGKLTWVCQICGRFARSENYMRKPCVVCGSDVNPCSEAAKYDYCEECFDELYPSA